MMKFADLTAREKIILKKFSRVLLKYTPYVAALLYTVFCLLRSLGFQNYMITSFVAYAGILWGPFHFASSYSSGFCVWHRRLIWYHGVTGVMVFLEMWIGFGPIRKYLNIAFFLWGLIICSIVTYKIYKGQFNCGHQDDIN